MLITTDDLCYSNLENFKYFDLLKKKYPELYVIAFTIANYKEQENLKTDYYKEFDEWYQERKEWVQIGVHGYDHDQKRTQEGFRKPDEQVVLIEKSIDILSDWLPDKPIYRPPGFRYTQSTVNICKQLGIKGFGYQGHIKYFDTNEIIPTFDTHCTYDLYDNPIGLIWNQI